MIPETSSVNNNNININSNTNTEQTDTIDLKQLSMKQIFDLQMQLKNALEKDIQTRYSKEFINHVGLENLAEIPVVDVKDLKLSEHGFRKLDLGKHSVVRGLKDNCPFIAIKVDLFNSKTNEKTTQVVEVIFGHSSECKNHKDNDVCNNYTTESSIIGADNETYNSGLYMIGGMVSEQFERVRKLLKGEEVFSESSLYYMKKA